MHETILFRVMKRALRGDDDDVIAFLKPRCSNIVTTRSTSILEMQVCIRSSRSMRVARDARGVTHNTMRSRPKGDKIGQILSLIIQIDRNVHVRDLLLVDYVERTVHVSQVKRRKWDFETWVLGVLACPFLRCRPTAAVSSKT